MMKPARVEAELANGRREIEVARQSILDVSNEP
jgi:hypothetical protein